MSDASSNPTNPTPLYSHPTILDADNKAPSTTPSSLQNPWSVESALTQIPPMFLLPTSPPRSPLPFLHFLSRLKTTKREGWRRFGIAHGESIADHMYRMSIITMLAPASLTSTLDIPKCTKMALVHDMAESLVGDITPRDGVGKEEKSRREGTTMDWLCGGLLGGVGDAGKGLRDVWEEYEEGRSREAVFVHDVDKIELLLQMAEYERSKEDGELDLGEFAHVARKIKLEEVKAWARELLKEREKLWLALGKDAKMLDCWKEI